MKKGVVIIGLIVCLAGGFGVGLLTGVFIPELPTSTLVEQIQARGIIIVGTSSDWPPFEIYNTTTEQYEGFDIDLTEMIADELDVTVQWSDMDFDALIGACTAGTIDMLAAAMVVTSARAEQLAHSVPYIRINEVVVVKGESTITIDSLEDLGDYTVGVQSGTTEDYEMEDLGLTPVKYARADVLMADLIAGNIDIAFVDEPVLIVYAKTFNLKSIFTVPSEPTCLWCRWEDPELMTVINNVIITAYKDGTLDTMVEQYFE